MICLRSALAALPREERLGKNTHVMLKAIFSFLHGFCSYLGVKSPVDKASGKGLVAA